MIGFDEFGVSGHPNHISAYHGCIDLLKQGVIKSYYKLESVNIVRKYTFFLDVFLASHNRATLAYMLGSPFPAKNAMEHHWTQWVWYRRLFVAFSRYVYFNELIEMKRVVSKAK